MYTPVRNHPKPPSINPRSVLGYLIQNGFGYASLVSKLCETDNLLATDNPSITVFVPYTFPNIQDPLEIRKFVYSHIISKPLTSAYMSTLGAIYVDTKMRGRRVQLNNYVDPSTTLVNGTSRIVGYTSLGNTQIYVIDKFIEFDETPY